MQTMRVVVPVSIKQLVQRRVSDGGYGSVSAYLRELIKSDLERSTKRGVEREVLKGLRSGEPTEMTDQDWEALRRRARQRQLRATKR